MKTASIGYLIAGLGLALICGCSTKHSKSGDDTFSQWFSGFGPSTAPSTQPAEAQAAVEPLLTKLNTDIAAKDWTSAGTDTAQLAPYSNQLTADQRGELFRAQTMIALNRVTNHNVKNQTAGANPTPAASPASPASATPVVSSPSGAPSPTEAP
jgi:hypothetical protein